MLVVVLTFPPPHPLPLPLSRSPPHFPAVFRSGNNFKFNLRLFIYSQANATRVSHAQLFSHIFGRGWGSLSTVISSCAHLHSASGARHTHPFASSGGSRHSTRAPSDKRRPAAPTAAAQFDASPCTVELALYWRHSLRIAGKQCNTPWGRCTQQGRKTDRQTDGRTIWQVFYASALLCNFDKAVLTWESLTYSAVQFLLISGEMWPVMAPKRHIYIFV